MNNIDNNLNELNELDTVLEDSEYVISFEPDYEIIKTDLNTMYYKWEQQIIKLCKKVGYERNINYNELFGIAFELFKDACKKYDPYFNGKFKTFGAFWYGYVKQRLYAYMQRYYYKQKKEQPTDFTFMNNEDNASMNNKMTDDMMLEDSYNLEDELLHNINLKNFLDLLTAREKEIYFLILKNYKQTEIAKMFGVSQSVVAAAYRFIKQKAAIHFNVDVNEYRNLATKKLWVSKVGISEKTINKIKKQLA